MQAAVLAHGMQRQHAQRSLAYVAWMPMIGFCTWQKDRQGLEALPAFQQVGIAAVA